MLVLLFPHVDWFADETSASARRLHWLVEKSSSEHPFFWRHMWLGCVCPAWCGGWLLWMLIEANGEEMADGRRFCSEHKEEEQWQAVGSSRDCTYRSWGDSSLHLLTAAHVLFVAGVTQAVSGLVDVPVLVSLMPEVAGEYSG